jgi:hypothetical protein
MFSNEIMTALISMLSALGIVVIKDIVLRKRQERRFNQRTLLQARIEHAYGPLEFLAYHFINTEDTDKQERLATEIKDVLRHRSHLLSEPTASAFYVLLENPNAGASLLDKHFYTEYLALKAKYYKFWDTKQDIGQQTHSSNRVTDNYVGGKFLPVAEGAEYDNYSSYYYRPANRVTDTRQQSTPDS